MEPNIQLELGPKYQVTYANGTKIVFRIVGGPNLDVIVDGDCKSGLECLLTDFTSITKISD